MKKVIGVLAIIILGVVAQSCGSGEKCPAYSEADVISESTNS